jgi:MscS family membrane protein
VLDIQHFLIGHAKVDQNQSNVVSFNKMLDSSLNLNLVIYTMTIDTAEFASIQQDILLGIMKIIDHHEAQCAFPSRSLYFAPSDIQSILAQKY